MAAETDHGKLTGRGQAVKVLVIAPHMDDEVLGCGGAVVRHLQAGDAVAVCVVANRAYGHRYDAALIEREKDACRTAKELLGYHDLFFLDLPDEQLDHSQIKLIVPLEEVVARVQPAIAYLPHQGDLNQDHRAVFHAALVACRPQGSLVKIIRVYEVPSSTDQVPAQGAWPFLPNYYVDISGVLDLKIKALSCYEAESRPFPHPRSREGLVVLGSKRGMEVGLEAAEAFMVLREVWDRPRT
ncbi:MAG: PIG-L family deacetylase [Proteobacteria bacterium]|nr:PIG-L family deacetylase [Pseudomonadota bacterium]